MLELPTACTQKQNLVVTNTLWKVILEVRYVDEGCYNASGSYFQSGIWELRVDEV